MRNEDSENSMFYMFSFITLYPSFTSLVPDDNPSHSPSVISHCEHLPATDSHCERLPARSHADSHWERLPARSHADSHWERLPARSHTDSHWERLPARSHADRKAQRCVSLLSPSDKPVGHFTKTDSQTRELANKDKITVRKQKW